MKRLSPWLPPLALVLIALPSLPVPLALDDWIQRALISRAFDHVGPWDLYNFAPGDASQLARFIVDGPYPWFTNPDLKIKFFRPFSVLLLHLDTWLFGANATLARLHSIAWALVMLGAARRLYARVLPRVALLASVLFAIDDSHLMPTIWLANRNSLVAGACALWGLVWHFEWRGGRANAWLASTALFAIALTAAEAALGVLAFVFAFELLRPRRQWLALAPVSLTLAVYAVIYKLVGAGAWGSATYVDPVREPLIYAREVPIRFLAMFGAWNSGIGADFWLAAPALRPVLVGAGLLAIPGWWWLNRATPLEKPERTTLKWLAAGAVVGVLPTLATFPADRLLLPTSFALCGILAAVLSRAWEARRWLIIGWATLVFGFAPLTSWVTTPAVFTNWARGVTRAAVEPRGVDTLEGRRVVVVAATDFAVALYGTSAMISANKRLPRTWQVLSMTPKAHRLTRVDATTFDLEVLDGRMLDSVFEENLRADRFPIIEGTRFELNGLSVTPTVCDGGKPVKVRVVLTLDPSEYTFVFWNGTELERLQLPAPGETLDLPRAPQLMEQILG